MTPEVRSAQKADIGELSGILGRAFYDDPVMRWMLPDDATRAERLARIFAILTRYHHLAGGGVEVACEGPAMGAAALCDPPNRWQRSPRVRLKLMPALVRALGLRALDPRGEPQHPEEPHWYFAFVGSDPGLRGRGFVHALMRSRLERCDAEHCPAYGLSTDSDNVPRWERFGFKVTGEIVLPGGGPTMWPMWRAAR